MQETSTIRGVTNYRALIGAKTTEVTRYIEYMDGSYMTDGVFSDSVDTPLGDVHYGKSIDFISNACDLFV